MVKRKLVIQQIPLRQIPLCEIDSATSSNETLINGWTSLKNFGSKSTGTPAA